MNISDTLLVKMIEKDMLSRFVAENGFVITEDKVLHNPTEIQVESNQAVYICYFRMHTVNPFLVAIKSGTSEVLYTPDTTNKHEVCHYESSVITSHFSRIGFDKSTTDSFLVRYVKVTFERSDNP